MLAFPGKRDESTTKSVKLPPAVSPRG